ncbi:MAG: hypothetical protein LBT76_00910 [Tannerella sp.]|nr:hypothetical protein [Tannerella sp.]
MKCCETEREPYIPNVELRMLKFAYRNTIRPGSPNISPRDTCTFILSCDR